jgi:hypothetical protein
VVFCQHIHLSQALIFFFWSCLTDTVYNRNTQLQELKENIHRETADIPAEQLQGVNQNPFHMCRECLHVEGQHFQHFLRSVKSNYFILNVISKIRMCLVASGALVAVKQSTR